MDHLGRDERRRGDSGEAAAREGRGRAVRQVPGPYVERQGRGLEVEGETGAAGRPAHARGEAGGAATGKANDAGRQAVWAQVFAGAQIADVELGNAVDIDRVGEARAVGGEPAAVHVPLGRGEGLPGAGGEIEADEGGVLAIGVRDQVETAAVWGPGH